MARAGERTRLLAALARGFDDATRATGTVTRRYELAGQAAELRLAGPELLGPLARSLAHLRQPAGSNGLTVRAWDRVSTGVPLPQAPWRTDDFLAYGTIRGFFDDELRCMFDRYSRVLTVLDVAAGEAFYVVDDADAVGYHERASPLRLVLHGWLRTKGVELVHAAAVGRSDDCALLVGKAGAGKSWTTLAALAGGLQVLGDDYVLLAPGSPVRAASIYSAAKTDGAALARLPFLDDWVANPGRGADEKAVYFLHEHAPDRLLLDAAVRAILVPRQTGSPGLTPTSPAAALAALAPSTILQLPGAGASTLARLSAVVHQVPCYHLDLGSDLEAVAPLIESVLH